MNITMSGNLPVFHDWKTGAWAVPDADENGEYYNIAYNVNGKRVDEYVNTPLEAYKRMKELVRA